MFSVAPLSLIFLSLQSSHPLLRVLCIWFMIVLYTDWSCLWNPWPGWWAVLVIQEMKEMERSWGKEKVVEEIAVLTGGEKMTTNNVMELTAAIQALKWLWERKTGKIWQWIDDTYLPQGFFGDGKMDNYAPNVAMPIGRQARDEGNEWNEDVVLITDSNYVKLGITERIVTRKRRQRRRAKGGKLVENVTLRKELDALAAYFPNLHWQRTKAHVGTEMNERVDQLARKEAGKIEQK